MYVCMRVTLRGLYVLGARAAAQLDLSGPRTCSSIFKLRERQFFPDSASFSHDPMRLESEDWREVLHADIRRATLLGR